MSNVQWGKTFAGDSWHVARLEGIGAVGDDRQPVEEDEGIEGLCGRDLDPDSLVDDRPGSEKTCETCLRIASPK